MLVGICDDDKNWEKNASDIIEEYARKASQEIEIQYFPDGDSLFNYQGEPIEALFLDIELGDQNGIDLAERVHDKWAECLVIFLTNYISYATDVYRTEHIWFAVKEQFQNRVGEIFDKIYRNREKQKRQLRFICTNKQMVCLAPDDIYYLERNERKTRLVTVWGNYEIKDKLDDCETYLAKPDFVRCHNSYIVYLPNVKQYTKGIFHMKNGDKLTVSRAYEKETKVAFTRWIMGQMEGA